MAFEDPAVDEELDYDNDTTAPDPGHLPNHPVLDDEEDLVDDDDDYEDLYGDVNVGMYSAAPPPSSNAPPNGDVDSVNEDEDGTDDLKVEFGDAGANSSRPQEEIVEYDYLPDVKEETLYGDSDVGPKPRDEQRPASSAPKSGKIVGGANGSGGASEAGRGLHHPGGGWPAGSGPAGRGLLHSCYYRFRSFSCVVCYLTFWQAAICMLEHMIPYEDLGFLDFVSCVGVFVRRMRNHVRRVFSMAWIRAGKGGRQSWRSNLCNVVPFSAIEVWYFTTLFFHVLGNFC